MLIIPAQFIFIMSKMHPTIDDYTAKVVEFLKDVDTMDVEQAISYSGSMGFAVGLDKNITYRTQIHSKIRRDGLCKINLHRGGLVTSEIYSAVGFDYLEVKIKLATSLKEVKGKLKGSTFEVCVTKYENIKPGWFVLPTPIVDNMHAKITLSYKLKSERVPPIIMLKNYQFLTADHEKFLRANYNRSTKIIPLIISRDDVKVDK